jgi:hypothetical protein
MNNHLVQFETSCLLGPSTWLEQCGIRDKQVVITESEIKERLKILNEDDR